MTWGFQKGNTYSRRHDIHDRFRGQERGGIITPAAHNLVIIITGDSGGAHGYEDRLRDDGVFEYFGEGQRGDMSFIKGNRAIIEHAQEGKSLLMFKATKQGLRFEGEWICEGYHTQPGLDTDGQIRTAIVFELRPLEAIIEGTNDLPDVGNLSLADLRAKANAAVRLTPHSVDRKVTAFERSRDVRAYVVARSKGVCEDCGGQAPFKTGSGQPFLEVHHIRRLSDGGPDDFRHMIALCPNCHRAAHLAADALIRNERMASFVRLIEQQA